MKFRKINSIPVVHAVMLISTAAITGAAGQIVTFNTSSTTATGSLAASFNATQIATGVSGTPSLSRVGLVNTGGAAGSFFSNGANTTNTLNLADDYVGFSVTSDASSVLFVTGINWTSQGSNTAPNSYATAYSTDGFSTSIQTTFTGTTATTAQARNFNIVDLITNDTLSVRLYNYGATSINGGTSASGGSFRVITPTVTGSTVTAASGAITLAAATEIRNSGAMSLGGVITGAFGVTKTGAGVLTLGGSSDYSGPTTVSAGTLVVNGSITSAVTVSTGASLGGNGSVGSAAFANNSIFSWNIAADGASYDSLITSAITGGEATFKIGNSDFAGDFWRTTRTWNDIFTTNGTSETALSNWATIFTSVTSTASPTLGSFSVSGNTLTWTAVPEPSSALAGLLIGAGLLRRRRSA